MRFHGRSPARLSAVAAVVLATAIVGGVPAMAAQQAVRGSVLSASPSVLGDQITFTGHGWGHGRGMGQYGALGYAVDQSKSAAWILDHFYGGSVSGTTANSPVKVELTALTGHPLVAIGRGLVINGNVMPDGDKDGSSVRVTMTEAGTFTVETATTCAQEPVQAWTLRGVFAGPVTIGTTSQSTYGSMVRTCEATGERAYRGELTVQRDPSSLAESTFNVLPVEDYLLGVVPRESPASWGSLGAGRGMEALKAQAVAARSYALASSRASGATTCDTTACQVYSGAAFQQWSKPQVVLESVNTNNAVAMTAGVVRRMAGTGAIARTEFSSSTGGYTAGGTFTAVPDDGDATASNPRHDWTVTVPTATVAAKLGVASIRSLTVTARNGLGADGGRVTGVSLVDGSGHVTSLTGNQVRAALGLNSDWFSISAQLSAEASNVVAALYHDLLGRPVDPAGLQAWTTYLELTGSATGLVQQIVTSPERMNKLVTSMYQSALLRDPEPVGLDAWVRGLEAGQGVYDLQVGIYGSPESLGKLGAGSIDAWIGALYTGLLGRPSSAAERAAWADVALHRGRASVVVGIAQSPEAGRFRLNGYYQLLLQRDVDPGGLAAFLPLMTGRGDFDVPVQIGGSPEYWSKAQTRTF